MVSVHETGDNMSSTRFVRRRRTGGAAVELIVIFPVMLLLIIGIVDYGRVFYTWVTVSNAARAGAEFGQQRPDTRTNTDSMAAISKTDGTDAGTLTFTGGTPTWFCECAGVADAGCAVCAGGAAPEVYVKVTVSKTVNMFLAYPGLPSSVTISRTAIMRAQ
jgi:Flp pilus assembly protein TadG